MIWDKNAPFHAAHARTCSEEFGDVARGKRRPEFTRFFYCMPLAHNSIRLCSPGFLSYFRDCAIIIRRGTVKREGGGAQCKLTAIERGVTCKFLGKWGGMATEKLTLRFKYQKYFT